MRCDWVQEQLSAFLDGELEAQDRDEVERELATCTQCQDVYQSVRRVHDRVAGLERLTPPAGLADRISASLYAKPRPVRLARRPGGGGWLRWFHAAGAAAVLMVAGIVALELSRISSAPSTSRSEGRAAGTLSENRELARAGALKSTAASDALALDESAPRDAPARAPATPPVISAEKAPQGVLRSSINKLKIEDTPMSALDDDRAVRTDKSSSWRLDARRRLERESLARPAEKSKQDFAATPESQRTPGPAKDEGRARANEGLDDRNIAGRNKERLRLAGNRKVAGRKIAAGRYFKKSAVPQSEAKARAAPPAKQQAGQSSRYTRQTGPAAVVEQKAFKAERKRERAPARVPGRGDRVQSENARRQRDIVSRSEASDAQGRAPAAAAPAEATLEQAQTVEIAEADEEVLHYGAKEPDAPGRVGRGRTRGDEQPMASQRLRKAIQRAVTVDAIATGKRKAKFAEKSRALDGKKKAELTKRPRPWTLPVANLTTARKSVRDLAVFFGGQIRSAQSIRAASRRSKGAGGPASAPTSVRMAIALPASQVEAFRKSLRAWAAARGEKRADFGDVGYENGAPANQPTLRAKVQTVSPKEPTLEIEKAQKTGQEFGHSREAGKAQVRAGTAQPALTTAAVEGGATRAQTKRSRSAKPAATVIIDLRLVLTSKVPASRP